MTEPNWADKLPIIPVNNGHPPRVDQLPSNTLIRSGKRFNSTNACQPRLVSYGLPDQPNNLPIPEKCKRGNFARLGKRLVE